MIEFSGRLFGELVRKMLVVAGVVAPCDGGWLSLMGSWRWIFLINVPVAVVVLPVSVRHFPETRDDESSSMDWGGSAQAVVTFAAATLSTPSCLANP